MTQSGPLVGVRVLEMSCPGPCQFAGMLLADLGATVIRLGRLQSEAPSRNESDGYDYMSRGRALLRLDLTRPQAVHSVRELCASADVLIEGFRPGVMERLGLGPAACHERNPRLIYGRATGWGQTGPLASRAGHDINFLALSGALHAFGSDKEPPVPPLNLLGDFGAGAMLLVVGILCAWVERQRSGAGQVVDASILDGVLLMTTMFHGLIAAGEWRESPGTNFLDGAAPMYAVYPTSDRQHVAVGPLEPKFYRQLLERLDIDASDMESHYQATNWPTARKAVAAAIARHPRAHWAQVFGDGDACVTPVLSFDEARANEHVVARNAFIAVDGGAQPAPAPRFSRTPAGAPRAAAQVDLRASLREFGLDEDLTNLLATQSAA